MRISMDRTYYHFSITQFLNETEFAKERNGTEES